jgi:glycolate oxidase FAD binding subunit
LRDALLGARLVNGRAEPIKMGGRVVKNVTGLDLARLQAGARGRFGVLTQVTFKLLPKPPARATLALDGLDDATALAALSAALRTPYEVSGAAHLSARKLTLLRLENVEESVAYRAPRLIEALAPFGRARLLDSEEADALWRQVRDLTPFASPDARAVWRVATAPSRASAFVARMAAAMPVEAIYDWGGGLIHLAVPAQGDAGAHALRVALGGGGQARLLRGPALAEPARPMDALTRRIAEAFDPSGVFAPPSAA